MTGRAAGRAAVLWRTALLALAALCWFLGLKESISMEKNSALVLCLSSFYPDAARAEEIIKEEQQKDAPRDVCFSWDGGIQIIKNEAYGKTREVSVTGLLGDGSLYSWQAAALSPEDAEGCILDRKSALALFGSPHAEGGRVTLGEKEYVVRRVADWKTPVILIRPAEKALSFSRVFLRQRDGESRSQASREFLMGSGLSGVLTEDGAGAFAAGLMLWLLPGLAVFFLMKRAVREKKSLGENTLGDWLWSMGIALVLVVFVFCIYQRVKVPGDWLPDKWSDFSFWTEKIKETGERFSWYLIQPKTAPQAERFLSCLRACAWGMLAFLLGLFAKRTV